MDEETKTIYKQGEELRRMVKSKGWKIAKNKLYKRIGEVSSVLGVEISGDPQKDLINMGARQIAVDTMLRWLEDIDGEIRQHIEQNKEIIESIEKEEYQKRFE